MLRHRVAQGLLVQSSVNQSATLLRLTNEINMHSIDLRSDEIDAIIFDCDGTLVDSEPITVQVLVDYVAEFGLRLDYEDALGLFVGRDMTMIVEVLEKQIGNSLPADFVEEYRRRQNWSYGAQFSLFPVRSS